MFTIRRSLILLLPLAGCAQSAQPAQPTNVPASYFAFCYQTLAYIDCHDQPDRGREATFVGAYEFDEPTPADKVYWLWRWRAEAAPIED